MLEIIRSNTKTLKLKAKGDYSTSKIEFVIKEYSTYSDGSSKIFIKKKNALAGGGDNELKVTYNAATKESFFDIVINSDDTADKPAGLYAYDLTEISDTERNTVITPEQLNIIADVNNPLSGLNLQKDGQRVAIADFSNAQENDSFVLKNIGGVLTPINETQDELVTRLQNAGLGAASNSVTYIQNITVSDPADIALCFSEAQYTGSHIGTIAIFRQTKQKYIKITSNNNSIADWSEIPRIEDVSPDGYKEFTGVLNINNSSYTLTELKNSLFSEGSYYLSLISGINHFQLHCAYGAFTENKTLAKSIPARNDSTVVTGTNKYGLIAHINRTDSRNIAIDVVNTSGGNPAELIISIPIEIKVYD